ncbi:hypothetical protein [Ascidiimonas sp. W6]|uniref:glycosyltransferase n=1 Tax=Ascidiimonas meishanensis TaxID=3128903 RepID=UPI0030EBD474
MKTRRSISLQKVEKGLKSKYAYFNLKGPVWHFDSGRYTYLLIKSFHLAGFPVLIRKNYGLLSRLVKYKSLLLKLSFKIVSEGLDTKKQERANVIHIQNGSFEKRVHLCFKDEIPAESSTTFLMPYLMHPMMYAENYLDSIYKLREKDTSFKIIFAGNTDEKEYSRSILKDKFAKTNRFLAISYLIENLLESQVISVKNDKTLACSGAYLNKLLLVQSSHLKVPFKNWLPTLAKADFFLACSGSRMPMCHNVIEAMAVGAIPILEYPEYFHPPLKHGYNCIVYKGVEDLKNKIDEVLIIDEEKIKLLKQNVVNYYDTYLDASAWINDLLEMPYKEVELVVNAHLVPSNKEIPTDVYTSEDSIPNLTNQKLL